MSEITMPRLSDSMEKGTILTWLKADGEHVAKDEDLVEIETDKATMTYPSPGEGVLSIVAPVGSELQVGAPIGSLAARQAGSRLVDEQSPARPLPHAERSDDQTAQVGGTAVGSGGAGRSDGLVKAHATPIARRLAQVHGVDLARLRGSGPRGRVMRRDVAAAAQLSLDAPVHVGAATSPAMAWPESSAAEASNFSIRTPTRVQQVIARRMVQAHASVPDFQVQTEVAMDGALRLREQLKEAAVAEIVPSINDIIVKACAIALRSHPTVNSSYRDDGFHVHSRVNIGVAVAAEQALLVPTIFDADVRSLGSLARESRRLAERARAGAIAPEELSGATFTVSNLGMFGMTAIKPIVNTPQAAILGVGALRPVLVRDAEGELADRSVLTLTLSCDHRIVYGAEAARFLADVKALLEAPMNVLQ